VARSASGSYGFESGGRSRPRWLNKCRFSARGHHMTASQQRVQRGVNPSGVSLVNISASPGVEGVAARDTVITDDFARRRADNLDAEAAYYRPPGHPTGAGPGPWLLRRPGPGNGYRPGRDGPADTDPERSNVMSVPGDPARRRRRQPPSQFPDRNRRQRQNRSRAARGYRAADRRPQHAPRMCSTCLWSTRSSRMPTGS
jgi:hypothetical protein